MRARGKSTRRGAAAVELALVMPITAILITGIFDVARLLQSRSSVQYAAQQGARTGAVLTASTPDSITAVVRRVAYVNARSLTVTVTINEGARTFANRLPGDRLAVTVSYGYRPMVGMGFERTTVSLTGRAAMIVE